MTHFSGIPIWREIGATPLAQPHMIEHARVTIVGGGPVGLTLALDLVQKGHRVLILNQMDFVAAGSKAICFAKRTLDIWDRLGVGSAIASRGIVWNVGKVFRGESDDPLYQFDMLPIKGQKNPGFINLQQYHVEDILIDALASHPMADLRWGHRAAGVRQSEKSVTVDVTTETGTYVIETDWLIACDGSRSPVRTMLGLTFEGRAFEDNFLIADVRFKKQRPVERWFWFNPPFSPGGSALMHKQPGDIWRLDFQLGPDIDREACVRAENVEPLVRGMIGDDTAFEEEWYSVYNFQCRRMQKFVHHRIVFAGDSAHLVSPFGARGCNGGIADADNLGWKLDRVLRGKADVALIDSYNDEAIVSADENILNSTRSTDFMAPKSKVNRAFRDAVLDLASEHAFARPFVNSGRLSTPVGYPNSALNTPDREKWDGGVEPGSPALDARMANGWLLDHLGNEFILMKNGGSAASTEVQTIDLVDENNSEFIAERYALPPGGAYLFRPDQYVAARWHAPSPTDIQSALARATGATAYDRPRHVAAHRSTRRLL